MEICVQDLFGTGKGKSNPLAREQQGLARAQVPQDCTKERTSRDKEGHQKDLATKSLMKKFYLIPEEQLRRLAYCTKLLPSPLYKKERLMPTNPEAQRRFAVRDEEQPAPSINIRAREERKREEEVTLREMLAYLDEEEDEKEEKEEEEMAAKINLDIRLPGSSTRRSRTRAHNVHHQVSQASPMTWKNIMWTILLDPSADTLALSARKYKKH
ncbi:unnamed protein product [Ranitomeya imitator]|uniref:Uncharacterized protein n=1 Tax=Ranitomeya imitator TaxID=111125 RepID=A0ABN9MD17_9NEOB|nr:unnamed protein product [Ranitomeya imitator]